jgi:hypothetical protein
LIVALVGGVVASVPILWPGDPLAAKLVAVVVIFATAFGVYKVKNEPM